MAGDGQGACDTNLYLGLHPLSRSAREGHEKGAKGGMILGESSTNASKKMQPTKEQEDILKENFRTSNYVSVEDKNRLAERFGVQPQQIEHWFKNKRRKLRTKYLEVECEVLRRTNERLVLENENLRVENAQVRADNVQMGAWLDSGGTEPSMEMPPFHPGAGDFGPPN